MSIHERIRKIDNRIRHLQQQVDTARRCGHFSPEVYRMSEEIAALYGERRQLEETWRQTWLQTPRTPGSAP